MSEDINRQNGLPEEIRARLDRINMYMSLIQQETSFIVADWERLSASKISKKNIESKGPLTDEQLNKVISDRLKHINIT